CCCSVVFIAPHATTGGFGAMADERCTPNPEPPYAPELRGLVQRAQSGDATALPELRSFLDAHPEVWQQVGEAAASIDQTWLGLMAVDHPLVVESLNRMAAERKAELEGERPSPVERLLVEQIVSTWLEIRCWETLVGQVNTSVKRATMLQKRLSSAHKRYL